MDNPMKIVFKTLLITFISSITYGQTIEKTFQGCWGDTNWKLQFSKNGNYKRISDGHYGFTTVKGKYKIENDTIRIISGYQKTHSTINELYIIDDNVLIDLHLGYGYVLSKPNSPIYFYDNCCLQYPNIKGVKAESITQMEKVLNLALNSNVIKQFYHFNSVNERKLVIANYHKLQANIEVENIKAIFKPKEQIQETFYLEFEEIKRCYHIISFTVNIHDEGVKIKFIFKQKNDKWKQIHSDTTEKKR